MDATPLTLGQELSGYVSQLDHGIRALRSSMMDRLRELALGGAAVGTGLNAPQGYATSVAAHIATLTGMPFLSAESLAAHDAVVAAHCALKTIADENSE
jgi:fumarate hydratase class II